MGNIPTREKPPALPHPSLSSACHQHGRGAPLALLGSGGSPTRGARRRWHAGHSDPPGGRRGVRMRTESGDGKRFTGKKNSKESGTDSGEGAKRGVAEKHAGGRKRGGR